MLQSNLHIAFAWVLKQPFYYLVKVLGLAIGVMSVALLIAYIDYVSQYDTHIENSEHIYRVMGESVSRENGEKNMYDFGSNAWIEPFRNEYQGMYDQLGVIAERDGVFTYETTVYDEEFAYAERAALPLLGITIIEGDEDTALNGPNKVILSESAALRYFTTTENVIGKTLTLDREHYLEVTGIYRDLPVQSSYPMDVLVSLETTERVFGDTTLRNDLWILYTRHTMLVSFEDENTAAFVNQDLRELPYRRSPEQHLPILERNFFALWLQPIKDIYLDPLSGGTDGHDYTRRNTFIGIWILSVLVILGACVNFASLTISQLQLRIKELGIRSSFGATKRMLTAQLITESLLVSIPAILLSVQFLYVIVPVFASVTGLAMITEDVLRFETWSWLALMIFLLCALVSAGPVIFTSAEKIKGGMIQIPFSRFGWRAGSTVIFFQFAISTLSALMVLGIFLQIRYLENTGSGFETDNLILADMKYQGANADPNGFEAIKNEMLQIPEVEEVTAISVQPPSTGSFTNWRWQGASGPVEHTLSHILVAPNFLDTYDIELIAGRNFSLDFPSEFYVEEDESQQNVGVVLTRAAVERFGMPSPEEAIGQELDYYMFEDPRNYIVIGVVEDFIFSPMESEINSIAILRGTLEPLRNLSMRVNDNYDASTLESIRAVWSEHLPQVPFNPQFMEAVIEAEIKGKTESLSLAVSLAAIVFFGTAIIGIYAQASFICDQSIKSIAIRKVLGGTISSILRMLVLRFTLPVICSFAIALPIAIYFLDSFYSSFQVTPGFPVHYYILCLSGIILLALITVFSHCRRTAQRHPVKSLRYE